MKTSKLAVNKSTLRNLTGPQMALVQGGAQGPVKPNPGGPIQTITSGGTSVISQTPGTSVISIHPSGG